MGQITHWLLVNHASIGHELTVHQRAYMIWLTIKPSVLLATVAPKVPTGWMGRGAMRASNAGLCLRVFRKLVPELVRRKITPGGPIIRLLILAFQRSNSKKESALRLVRVERQR